MHLGVPPRGRPGLSRGGGVGEQRFEAAAQVTFTGCGTGTL
jgi:hypothetical protein